MKALRIVSQNVTPNWWCKNCKHGSRVVIKAEGSSFCDECVPEQFKDKLITVDQNREVL